MDWLIEEWLAIWEEIKARLCWHRWVWSIGDRYCERCGTPGPM